jgi:hypothetical protein
MAGGDHNSARILRDCLFKLERLACVFTWAELLSQWLAKQPQLAAFEHGGYLDDDQMRLSTSDATLMGWYYWRISPDILVCYEGQKKPQPLVLWYDMRFSDAHGAISTRRQSEPQVLDAYASKTLTEYSIRRHRVSSGCLLIKPQT